MTSKATKDWASRPGQRGRCSIYARGLASCPNAPRGAIDGECLFEGLSRWQRRLYGRRVGKDPAPPHRHGRVEEYEEAGGLPQHEEVLSHGKVSDTCDSVNFCSLISHSQCACSNWQAVQATYRLEDEAKEQSRSLETERNKRLDATQTLKNSEADLTKAKEEAYDLGVVETQATLKAQIPRVCRLYCSLFWNEVLKQAGVEASSNLWKVEKVYYPPAIRETTPANSEAESALEEAETARPEAALAVTTPNEPAEGGGLPGATEAHGSLNPEAPQEAAESTAGAQASHAEEPALLVQSLQIVPPADVSKGLEVTPAQLPKEGVKIKLKK